jgi:hypothetical protein
LWYSSSGIVIILLSKTYFIIYFLITSKLPFATSDSSGGGGGQKSGVLQVVLFIFSYYDQNMKKYQTDCYCFLASLARCEQRQQQVMEVRVVERVWS